MPVLWGYKDSMSTLLWNVRLRDPLQKKLYNGLMKVIVVRFPLPLRSFCVVLFLAPKKQT